jgi:hypothetical protein
MGYQDIPSGNIGLSLPSSFNVTNSPVNGSGTLTATYANQTANTVFAGPQSGAAGTPSFRPLIPSDLGSSTGNCARYYSSSAGISASLATVSYNTRGFDPNAGYFNGTYTIPAGGSGVYHVSASLLFAGTIALNNTANMQIVQAGSSNQVSESKLFAGGAMTDLSVTVSDIFVCQPADTIKILAASNATGPSIAASSSQNFFSITQVL